jgi:hypothetical protein
VKNGGNDKKGEKKGRKRGTVNDPIERMPGAHLRQPSSGVRRVMQFAAKRGNTTEKKVLN